MFIPNITERKSYEYKKYECIFTFILPLCIRSTVTTPGKLLHSRIMNRKCLLNYEKKNEKKNINDGTFETTAVLWRQVETRVRSYSIGSNVNGPWKFDSLSDGELFCLTFMFPFINACALLIFMNFRVKNGNIKLHGIK